MIWISSYRDIWMSSYRDIPISQSLKSIRRWADDTSLGPIARSPMDRYIGRLRRRLKPVASTLDGPGGRGQLCYPGSGAKAGALIGPRGRSGPAGLVGELTSSGDRLHPASRPARPERGGGRRVKSDVRAVPSLSQETGVDERREERGAGLTVETPEPLGLGGRQSEAWHFQKLSPNPLKHLFDPHTRSA